MLFVGNNALILLMYVNVLYIFCTILSCDVLISIGSTYWPTVFWLPRRRHKFVSTRYCQCQSQTHPSRNPRPPTALQKRKSNSQKISILPTIRILENKTYENNIFSTNFPDFLPFHCRLARSAVKYTGALRLNMPARGSLTGLRCVPQADTAKTAAPAPTAAQLRIRAVGLNFRDVLNAAWKGEGWLVFLSVYMLSMQSYTYIHMY